MTGIEFIASALLLALGGGDPLPQDPDRPALVTADIEALKKANIFSPAKPRRETPREDRRNGGRREETSAPAAPPKPQPPVVTGIVLDSKTGGYQVVVEDRNEEKLKVFKEPKFLKAGDEVAGCTIESVVAGMAVVKHGETSKELRVGDRLPDAAAAPAAAPDGKSPTSTEKTETRTLDEGTKNDVLEKLRKKNKKNRDADVPE